MQVSPPSLLHAVQNILEEEPDREAVAFHGARVTYRELAGRALALAEELRGLGIKPGDRVAALVTPRPEALVSLFAVWLAGATWVGVNTRYKFDEQRSILDDSGAEVLFSITGSGTADLSADLVQHESAGIHLLRIGAGLWEGDFPTFPPQQDVVTAWDRALEDFTSDIPAVVIYTSGSTGHPKGALITHAGLAFRASSMARDRFDGARIRLLLDLPINHIGALASGVGLALVTGGFLVLSERFDPGATLNVIEAEKLTVFAGVPAMLGRLVEDPRFETADLSSLKYISWGAGPVSAKVLERLAKTTQAAFSQQYGMTESNGPIVYTPPTRDLDILLNTTGRPDPRLELRIANDRDQAVPDGQEGEVQVRMPFPFAGYLNNPAATAEAHTFDGFLRTGDRARLRPDGYLVFSGRSKEMFKSGGFNVYPREVEMVLESHPAIRAAAVLGREDPAWGQVGVAFVELSEALEADAIAAWCKSRLADFKVPKEFRIVEALPRTTVDKVDRVALFGWISPSA